MNRYHKYKNNISMLDRYSVVIYSHFLDITVPSENCNG